MIGKVFSVIVLLSVLCSLFTGNTLLLSDAIIGGVSDAVSISFSMIGIMCLWSGVMKIFESAGVTKIFAKILKPAMSLVYSKKVLNSKALESICCCFAANFLGLGNAALPLGINAVKKIKDNNSQVANSDMIMFAVLNTVPFQLIPSTLIALRKNYNSTNPFSVILPIWLCSFLTIVFAVILCKIFAFLSGKKNEC